MKKRITSKMKKLMGMVTAAGAGLFSMVPVSANGDVAGAIQNTWTAARAQVESIVNNVVFPVIDVVLAIWFFVKVATCYADYRKHGQFDSTAPAILFACLIFSLTAPLYLWTIV